MKTTIKILLALVLSASLFACTNSERNPEFTSYTFVTFTGTSYTVAEDTVSFTVPVQVYPKPNGDITVTLAVVDDPKATATLGTDFSLENDVLTFSAADTVNTQAMIVNVVNHSGVFTNTLEFALEIAEVVGDNVVIGTNNYVPVTIKDLDHPLSAILGDYNITGKFFYASGGSAYPFTAVGFSEISLKADKDDVTKVWFSSLTPITSWYAAGDASVYGIVSDDMKTIKVPFGQQVVLDYGEGDTDVAVLETVYDSEAGVVALDPEGKFITFTRAEGDGVVYSTNEDWDYWDLDEGGNPVYINAPVLGNKWAPLFSWESQATVITKK